MESAEQDLDLAVELVNAHLLADPADQPTDQAAYERLRARLADHEISAELSVRDLPLLRELSADLAPLFAAATVTEAVGLLDPLQTTLLQRSVQ